MKRLILTILLVMAAALVTACTPEDVEQDTPGGGEDNNSFLDGLFAPQGKEDPPAPAPQQGKPVQDDDPGDGEEGEPGEPALELIPDPTPTPELPPVQLIPGEPGDVVVPVTGEIPADLLNQIIAALAEKLGIDPGAIAVVKAESVTWNDGSLGCPQPGLMYTQALVPGYHVVLDVNGAQYDFRVSQNGFFLLCENGGTGSIGGAEPYPGGGVNPVVPGP